MSNDSYQRGRKDADDGKAPAHLWNAPSPVRERYNAGYARKKEENEKK